MRLIPPILPRYRAATAAAAMLVIATGLSAAYAAEPTTPAARANGGFTVAAVAGRKCYCTREYKPVCGLLPNGRMQTFANACTADCAGAMVVRRGRC